MVHESHGQPATHLRMAGKLRLTLGLLAPLACDPSTTPEPDPTMSGELQRGDFEYRCAGSNDAFCVDFVAQSFPSRFAVGGHFEVALTPSVDVVAVPAVESSAPSLLAPTFSGLISEYRFLRPGTAALIAVISGDEIVDYLHITGERVLSYHFSDDQGGRGLTEIVLAPGERRTVTVEPRGELGQQLAGTLEYAWSTDESSVARVASETSARSVQVQGVAPGTTRLLVEGGEVIGSVQIIVQEDSGTTTTGPDTDPDTDTGTDTDTTTGTDTDSGTDTDTETGTGTDGTTGGGR